MSNDDMDATETFGGTCITIATSGNYTLDTRDASAAGDAMLRPKPGASLKIDIGATTALRIEDVGGWLRIELGGDADQRLVLGDKLVERLNAFFEAAFDLHVHATPMARLFLRSSAGGSGTKCYRTLHSRRSHDHPHGATFRGRGHRP
jgi:hypothetical protein